MMDLQDINKPIGAAAVRARVWADRLEWTVTNMEKAGLKKIELVRGYMESAHMIEHEGWVILGQLGDDYLLGKLTN